MRDLKALQQLPLDTKVLWTLCRIQEALEYCDANGLTPLVSYSKGKDSTLLKHLVRMVRPSVTAVFVNTGLEWTEVVAFDKDDPNVVEIRPDMAFTTVLEKYGYPVVSKSVSMAISRYRNTQSQTQRDLRLHGGVNPSSGKVQSVGVIPQKYHYIVDAPFKISERCCDVMKKKPLKAYAKQTNGFWFIGTMASDSEDRRRAWQQSGCNVFNGLDSSSRPLSIWTEQDVLTYLERENIPISPIYGEIVENPDGTLRMTGEDRTGCIFCLFGIFEEQRKRGCNRFQRMHKTHPQLHKYCMNKLGIKNVMDYLGLPTEA